MHPGVLEAAAIGVPDERSGEAVKIVVVRKDPALTEDALLAHCRKHLTGYKVPRIVDSAPSRCRSPISARSCAARAGRRRRQARRVDRRRRVSKLHGIQYC